MRSFVETAAHNVTQDGPIAWRKHFSDRPAFFMVVDGQMVFKDGETAKNALPNVALAIRHIELNWGDNLRVDPLTSELAVVAAPYQEIRVDAGGHRVEETGYFTAVAELRDGRWQFRDAHWSSAPSRHDPVTQ